MVVLVEKNVRDILSTNVKYYKFEKGLTQEELAELCDISRRYLSDIENPKGNIPLDTLEILLHYLNVKPYMLLLEKTHKIYKKVIFFTFFAEKNIIHVIILLYGSTVK